MKNGRYVDKLGVISWYSDGQLHRLEGHAVELPNGVKEWYFNGMRHREDGPAIICPTGAKEWFQNGLLHRLDGPAREIYGRDEWWIQGNKLTEEEFQRWCDKRDLNQRLTVNLPKKRKEAFRKI